MQVSRCRLASTVAASGSRESERTEDLLDLGPGGLGSSGHHGRTVSGSLLSSGDSGSNEQETLGLELGGSSDRVGVVRVSTVNDDVSLLELRNELADEVVNSGSGLDEEDD